MDYLLTWTEGEEVNYRFLNLEQIRRFRLEEDKNYSLTNLKSGYQVEDIDKFIKEVA